MPNGTHLVRQIAQTLLGLWQEPSVKILQLNMIYLSSPQRKAFCQYQVQGCIEVAATGLETAEGRSIDASTILVDASTLVFVLGFVLKTSEKPSHISVAIV